MALQVPFQCRFMQTSAAAVEGVCDLADKKFGSIGYSWIQSFDLMEACGLTFEAFEKMVKKRSSLGHDESIWHWRVCKKFWKRVDPMVLKLIREFQADMHQAEIFPPFWLAGEYLITNERARSDHLTAEQQMHWARRVLFQAELHF